MLDGLSGLSDDDPDGLIDNKNKPDEQKNNEDDDDWGALGLDDEPATIVDPTQKSGIGEASGQK